MVRQGTTLSNRYAAHAGDGAQVQDHQSEILTEPVENTMGAYAQCAEVLVERGYATIPIMAGSKAPGFYCAGLWVPLLGWQRRYLHGRTPNYMDHNLWGSGNAGIGVVGGKASHGLVAIDIDTDDAAIQVAIVKVLPPT